MFSSSMKCSKKRMWCQLLIATIVAAMKILCEKHKICSADKIHYFFKRLLVQMEQNKTYTVSEAPDCTESYEESRDYVNEVEEIYVTPSSTHYPNTTSDSSFNFDLFDLENAHSTSTSEISFAVNSDVSRPRIEAKQQHCILRKPTHGNQNKVRNDKPQKIVVKIKKLQRKPIQEESSTSSECTNSSRRNNARRRATKETTERYSENDNSETLYPESASDDDGEEWDSVESSESTDTIDEFSESLLDAKMDGFGSTIEHDIVATKYGLPYDIIICRCNAQGITQFSLNRSLKVDNDVSITKNCYNFEDRYGKISQRALRKWSNSRRTEEFRKASSVYDIFIKDMDPRIEKILNRAECGMKLFYPYCWIHLMEKYQMDLDDNDDYQEMRSKKAVIASCRRVLREQEIFARHYRVRMVDFGRNIKFGKRTKDLDRNFEMGCTFLKKEYPSLFIHLIKKYRFSKFVVKRMSIERNRLKFIKKWRSPKELKAMEAEIRASRHKHYLY